MIQRIVLGILGGALIVLSVFTVGDSVAFDKGVPDSSAAWVVLSAGAVVALFAIVGVRTLIGFGAGAAAAVAATEIVDAARAGDFTLTARLTVLVVGVLAALAATTGRRRKTVIVEPVPIEAAPVEAVPVEKTVPVAVVPVEPTPVAVKSVTPVSAEKVTTSKKTTPKTARKVRASR
jgi:hypothetical protein